MPNLSLYDSLNTLGSLRLGKYTAVITLSMVISIRCYMTSYEYANVLLQWFNDVHSTDISDTCEDVLSLLSKTHGCEVSHHHCHVLCIFLKLILVS